MDTRDPAEEGAEAARADARRERTIERERSASQRMAASMAASLIHQAATHLHGALACLDDAYGWAMRASTTNGRMAEFDLYHELSRALRDRGGREGPESFFGKLAALAADRGAAAIAPHRLDGE